jgi:hypothetical protein
VAVRPGTRARAARGQGHRHQELIVGRETCARPRARTWDRRTHRGRPGVGQGLGSNLDRPGCSPTARGMRICWSPWPGCPIPHRARGHRHRLGTVLAVSVCGARRRPLERGDRRVSLAPRPRRIDRRSTPWPAPFVAGVGQRGQTELGRGPVQRADDAGVAGDGEIVQVTGRDLRHPDRLSDRADDGLDVSPGCAAGSRSTTR